MIASTQRYILALLLFGVSAGFATAQPTAVDLLTARDESALRVLLSDGSIWRAGDAPDYGAPSGINAVDIEATPSGKGYYILDIQGNIHRFGDAKDFGQPVLDRNDSAVDIELTRDGESLYLLTRMGRVYTFGQAVFYGENPRDNAVDIELAPDEKGYYVLYENGVIDTFGSAVARGYAQSNLVKSVDLAVEENGYYVLHADGSVLPFGQVPSYSSPGSGSQPAVAMTLTGSGYRVLYQDAEVRSFMRVESQSQPRMDSLRASSNLFTQMAQTLPQQVPTPTPRPDAPYLDLTDNRFTQRVIGRIPSSETIPGELTTGQLSLPSGGTFLISANADHGTARRIRYYPADGALSADFEGSLFAELPSGRGEAMLRGISYSASQGIIVLIEDVNRILLVNIQGDFEPAGIRSFVEH